MCLQRAHILAWPADRWLVNAPPHRYIHTVRITALQSWKVDRRKVEAFLTAAEQAYGRGSGAGRNPYHNSTHAADVVQAAFIMLRSVQQPQFTKLEVSVPRFYVRKPVVVCRVAALCSPGAATSSVPQQHLCVMRPKFPPFWRAPQVFGLLLAAIVHDIAHTGVTNDFLAKTGDALALAHGCASVNEKHHLATAFSIASQEETNIFAGLTPAETAQVHRAARANAAFGLMRLPAISMHCPLVACGH